MNTCRNCTRRHLGCHSQCATYEEYKQYLADLKETKRLDNLYKGFSPAKYHKTYSNNYSYYMPKI